MLILSRELSSAFEVGALAMQPMRELADDVPGLSLFQLLW
jgi:hypothetical protein